MAIRRSLGAWGAASTDHAPWGRVRLMVVLIVSQQKHYMLCQLMRSFCTRSPHRRLSLQERQMRWNQCWSVTVVGARTTTPPLVWLFWSMRIFKLQINNYNIYEPHIYLYNNLYIVIYIYIYIYTYILFSYDNLILIYVHIYIYMIRYNTD